MFCRNIYKSFLTIIVMEKRRILGIFLFAILIISFLSFVSAAEGDGVFKALWDAFFGGVFDGFDGSGGFDFKLEISRYLLVGILALLVYSISQGIPFLSSQKDYIKWAFAIAVALLGFLFVTAEEIKLLLTNYEALGVVITSIIPLIILFVFGFELRSKNPAVAGIVNKILYIGFAFYLLFTWASAESSPLRNVYLVTFVIVIIWLFIEKQIWQKYMKEKFEAGARKLKEKFRKSSEVTQNQAETFDNLTYDDNELTPV